MLLANTKHGYCRCPHPPIHRGLAVGLCNNDHRFIAPYTPSMGQCSEPCMVSLLYNGIQHTDYAL
jgi:hypothetical protein